MHPPYCVIQHARRSQAGEACRAIVRSHAAAVRRQSTDDQCIISPLSIVKYRHLSLNLRLPTTEFSDWESDNAKDDSLLTFWINRHYNTNLYRRLIYIERLIGEGWVGCASRLGERRGRRWLLPAKGAALEVKQVGIHRGRLSPRVVTFCLRALRSADSIWYVN
jgi:hypothetical protein